MINFFISRAYAATSQAALVTSTAGLMSLLCNIFSWMFYLLMAISSVMVLVAGYIYLTADGDSEKISRATKTITYAAIGIAVALLAREFPAIVGGIFGQNYAACGSTASVNSTISYQM